MRNVASFESKLLEIEEAEEDLILYGYAWVAGVKFLKSNPEFQNISCLRFISKFFLTPLIHNSFQNISCLRFIVKLVVKPLTVSDFKTFHV